MRKETRKETRKNDGNICTVKVKRIGCKRSGQAANSREIAIAIKLKVLAVGVALT